MNITLDEGYMFGLGAFETIAIENRKAIFLEEHLQRLKKCLVFLEIQRSVDRKEIEAYLEVSKETYLTHGVLKIMISEKNTIFTTRPNPYMEDQYKKGYHLNFSSVLRNETSPFTYYKTTNYGDCIGQKRQAVKEGKDDYIFLNTRGEITECTSSNLFFIKDGKICSPAGSCGLLPGIIRDYMYLNYPVQDAVIRPEEVVEYDECFVTNSLMGIMPVMGIGKHEYKSHHETDRVRTQLNKYLVQHCI